MNDNPFLSVLKIAFTGVLAFLVFLSFWQRTHLEDQVAGLSRESSGLADRVSEMSRKVDDLKAKADRLEGAADAMSKMVGEGIRVAPIDRGSAPSASVPTRPSKEWGWELNASL